MEDAASAQSINRHCRGCIADGPFQTCASYTCQQWPPSITHTISPPPIAIRPKTVPADRRPRLDILASRGTSAQRPILVASMGSWSARPHQSMDTSTARSRPNHDDIPFPRSYQLRAGICPLVQRTVQQSHWEKTSIHPRHEVWRGVARSLGCSGAIHSSRVSRSNA